MSIPTPAPQPVFTLDPADAAEFTRLRSEVLPSRRRELSQTECAREEYRGFRALGEKIPFLSRREWIPPQPVLMPWPGSDRALPVEIVYDANLDRQFKPEWTEKVLRAAQSILPHFAGQDARAASFAEALALTRGAGAPLFNGLCYRLLSQRLFTGEEGENRARLELRFGVTRYFDYLNTTEVLAHEAAMGESRKVREAAGHWLGDLHLRHAGSGICALTIIRRENGEHEFLMMDRSRSQVHTGLGLLHVRPAGEFQPLSENPDQFAEECNLWYVLWRESCEEIGGVNMPRTFQSLREFLSLAPVAALLNAAKSGAWQTHYLGFGFDPLNDKPEFLLCSLIEEAAFQKLFPDFRAESTEGLGLTDGGVYGLRFTNGRVDDLLHSPRLHPAAAACLRLVQKHATFLLGKAGQEMSF